MIGLNEEPPSWSDSWRLADQLQRAILDASGELRDVNEERERNDKDVKECMDVLNSADSGLTTEAAEALEELDKVLQRQTQVSQQLELVAIDEHQGWRIKCQDLLEMEAAFAEREESLTTQCLDVEKSLANAQSRCEIVKRELQDPRQASTEKQTHVTQQDLPRDKKTSSRKKK